MRSILNSKILVLFLSILALGGMFILASGLRTIEFDPGVSFLLEEEEFRMTSSNPDQNRGVASGNQLLFWLMLAVLVALVSSLFIPELRKRLLRAFFNIGLTLFILSYLYENRMLSFPGFMGYSVGGASQMNTDVEGVAPPSAFVPPDESTALSYIITLALLLTVLLSGWFLLRLWKRLNPPAGVPDSLADLAAIARRSIKEISSGRDWQGVIQECYGRMGDAVGQHRGLKRQASMTTGEFAVKLEKAGLPGQPVRRLTRLFEAVRYGAHKTSKSDIDEAVSCLTDILHACGENL